MVRLFSLFAFLLVLSVVDLISVLEAKLKVVKDLFFLSPEEPWVIFLDKNVPPEKILLMGIGVIFKQNARDFGEDGQNVVRAEVLYL